MTPTIDALFQHLRWANDRVTDALRSANENPEALRLFAHVLAAEEVWLARIEGRTSRHAVWPALTLERCVTLSNENRAAFGALLARLGDEGLAREVSYRNSAGFIFTNTVQDVLLHVALHGHYHRGQIAARIRGAGHTPPYTDYIGFARREQEGGTLDAGRASRERG
jgi:uncharacterized damage-inducible protein DinB